MTKCEKLIEQWEKKYPGCWGVVVDDTIPDYDKSFERIKKLTTWKQAKKVAKACGSEVMVKVRHSGVYACFGGDYWGKRRYKDYFFKLENVTNELKQLIMCQLEEWDKATLHDCERRLKEIGSELRDLRKAVKNLDTERKRIVDRRIDCLCKRTLNRILDRVTAFWRDLERKENK